MRTQPVDHLIIGGGIAGVSLALDLAAGGGSIILLERRHVGSGSSSVNAGGVRQQFLQAVNIQIAAATVRKIERFREELGEDIGFRQTGYLLLHDDPAVEPALKEAVSTQNRYDVPTRMVGREEIAELLPGCVTDDILGASFGPTDGYVDPRALVTGYGRAARRAGVEIVIAEVESISTGGGRVTSVRAGGLEYSPGVVVNAAGAWAPKVARLYGADLPIAPMRSEIFVFDRSPVAGRLTPMVLDRTARISFHSEGRGLLVSAGVTSAMPDPDARVESDPARFPDVRARLSRRLPEMADAGLASTWAGLTEVTADFNPIVGWTHLDNVFTLAGLSGHGICLAPGLAPLAAALIRGEKPAVEINAYRPDRFQAGGELAVESLWNGAAGFQKTAGATG